MSNAARVKEETLCWFGIYVLADKALLPTCVHTEQGHFDTEPIREFDYRNRSALIEAIDSAMKAGNPEADVPPLENQKKMTPMEKLAGAKSWKDLERKSIYFSIMVHPSNVRIEAWGRAPDKAWSDEKDTSLDVRIPTEAGAGAIADAILEHLRTRKDLPGMTFDFPQPKTARGA